MRDSFKVVEGEVDVVLFDFDGTLTETPGEAGARRRQKMSELVRRAPMLRPRLEGLRGAGMTLGIMSKSTEQTIRECLEAADLARVFDGPIVGKALGFEGKAGFIADLEQSGSLALGPGGLSRVLLVDDDVRELGRSRERGIQTFAAPPRGGLQEEDFDDFFALLNLPLPTDCLDSPAPRP